MKLRFLTIKNVITGSVLSLLERCVGSSYLPQPIDGYKLIKPIKSQSDQDSNDIGIYQDSKKNKVFIKSVQYKWKNLFYEQLMNEASLLRVLNKFNKTSDSVSFSKLLHTLDNKNKLAIVVENIEGKKLADANVDTQLSVLDKCLSTLRDLSSRIENSIFEQLPKRPNIVVFVTFPMYFLLTLIKERSQFSLHFKNALLFYSNFPYAHLFNTEYELTHKDLDPENILLTEEKIFIIDPEVTTLNQKNSELSTIARFYYQTIPEDKLVAFISTQLADSQSHSIFTALTLFYAYQMLVIERKSTKYYDQAIKYLPYFIENIYPHLSLQHTLAEVIYSAILSGISTVTTIFKQDNIAKSAFILCYHSVGFDNWRFTTKPVDLKNQVEYLKKHFSIVPLSKMIGSPKHNSVAITFDDGYQNVFDTAYPILKAAIATATIFIVGQPTNINRSEIDNQLGILKTSQIKELYANGWEVGYHTATHSDLSKLSPAQLRDEIITSKNKLEKHLGIELSYFAYPRGFYNNLIIELVKEAGYKASFTVDGGAYNSNNNLLIPRVPMEGVLSLGQFKGLTTSLGLFFSKLFMNVLVLKSQITRMVAHS